MRIATTLLLATGALLVAGCSLLIDAELDEKSAASGSGGQGGSDMASSTSVSTSSATSTSTGGATSTSSAAQSAGASSGGGCGSDCVLANATSNCINGICAISVCNSQFDDCDLNPANGCEVNLNSDGDHCGSCGHTCKPGQKCAGSKCK